MCLIQTIIPTIDLSVAIFAFLLDDFNIFGGVRGPYSGRLIDGLHDLFPQGFRWTDLLVQNGEL